MRESVGYQRLAVLSNEEAEDLIAQQEFQAEVARIQKAIDYGTVWQDAYDSKLAAGFIASGLCRERRG